MMKTFFAVIGIAAIGLVGFGLFKVTQHKYDRGDYFYYSYQGYTSYLTILKRSGGSYWVGIGQYPNITDVFWISYTVFDNDPGLTYMGHFDVPENCWFFEGQLTCA